MFSLHSTQKLEKVKQVLLGEIQNLEQDEMALRNMEEELTVIQSAVTHKVIYFAESKLNERVIKESENIAFLFSKSNR